MNDHSFSFFLSFNSNLQKEARRGCISTNSRLQRHQGIRTWRERREPHNGNWTVLRAAWGTVPSSSYPSDSQRSVSQRYTIPPCPPNGTLHAIMADKKRTHIASMAFDVAHRRGIRWPRPSRRGCCGRQVLLAATFPPSKSTLPENPSQEGCHIFG